MIEGEYLLEAIKETLISSLTNITYPANSIRITVDERADILAGTEFIAIYKQSMENLHQSNTITNKESYSIAIGITMRLAGTPVDRVGEKLITYDSIVSKLKPSMFARARQVIDLIDGSTAVINLANAKGLGCPFIAPLGFTGDSGQITYVEEDHFFNEATQNVRPEGVFLELQFSGAFLVRVKAG